jgi:hypothetical protein
MLETLLIALLYYMQRWTVMTSLLECYLIADSACRSCNFGRFLCILVAGAAFLIALGLLLLA